MTPQSLIERIRLGFEKALLDSNNAQSEINIVIDDLLSLKHEREEQIKEVQKQISKPELIQYCPFCGHLNNKKPVVGIEFNSHKIFQCQTCHTIYSVIKKRRVTEKQKQQLIDGNPHENK